MFIKYLEANNMKELNLSLFTQFVVNSHMAMETVKREYSNGCLFLCGSMNKSLLLLPNSVIKYFSEGIVLDCGFRTLFYIKPI